MDRFGHGALTDVDGVRVGHSQRTARGWLTGTTVVLLADGAVAAVDVRGGGPGTRETDALHPGNLVDRVHAVCLTGGSAYGLAAADGVMAHLERRGLGVPVGPQAAHVVPVVPTAVVFDLGRGGRFDRRPDATFGERAIRAARASGVARGSFGAGTGAVAGGIRGGVGMASTAVQLAGATLRVAALAVVNASGSVIDPATALPWLATSALRRPSRADRAALAAASAAPFTPLNTTIGVVATDADLTRPEAARLALAAHDGLARAIRPAHAMTDGDTVFALASGAAALPALDTGIVRAPESRAAAISALSAAAADVFATACVDAVLHAGPGGPVASYAELCPSAVRGRRDS